MAFTRGLYYPYIDFQNEDWLRSAALYWDTLHTIAPVSLSEPYASRSARALLDEGVVQPLRVDSRMPEIRMVGETAMAYLSSPEGAAVVTGVRQTGHVYLHPDKLPRELHELASPHPGKVSDLLRRKFDDVLRQGPDGWLRVDPRFAAYYMTLLASELAKHQGLGLLADTPDHHGLASVARLDVQRASLASSRHRMGRWDGEPPLLAEGLLAQLSIQSLTIDPDVPIAKLIAFRRSHEDELGRFRTAVAELVSGVAQDLPIDALRQHVVDVHKNSVKPSLSALRKALRGSRIKWAAKATTTVGCFSASATAIPQMFGLSSPEALLAGAGVSLIAGAVMFNANSKAQLDSSPYSYLHRLSDEHGLASQRCAAAVRQT